MKEPKTESRIEKWGLWPRQALLFNSLATEIYFGGASEGGKSFGGRYCLAAWCAAIPNLRCYIFRKHYGDAVSNHMEGPASFKRILDRWIKDKLVTTTENSVKFVFNNSLITLHGLLHNKDLDKHVGREKHVLWIDEAGQIPKHHIDGLRAWVRVPKEMKKLLGEQLKDIYPWMTPEQRMGLFPRIIYTSNPEGPSLGFFRRQFVKGHEPMTIWRAEDKDGGFLRTFIPSKITDNPSADIEAQARRLLPLGVNRARALIEGDHDAPMGDFFKEYDDDLHAVEDFIPPRHWFKWRSFDWGSNDPFAVYWLCISDGEDFEYNGEKRWYPRGSIIVYREWYGCDEDEPSKGLHMRNEEICKGIIERTREDVKGPTLTDRFPFADRGSSKNGRRFTMADDFADNGVILTLANTSRVYGWKQIRSRLQGVQNVPTLYLCRSCVYLREYLPAIAYHDTDTEDAQTDGEATHSCDALRYGVCARPVAQDAPVIDTSVVEWSRDKFLTPKYALKQIERKRHARRRYRG